MELNNNNSKSKIDSITLAIILYFIERLNGILGKTHLQKMLFLSDLISIKKFKKPFTQLEYQKYLYGPFSRKVDEYVEELEKRGLIEVRNIPFLDNRNKFYTRYYLGRKGSIKNYLLKNLKPERVMLLDEIINSFGNISLQELLDIVYELEIVKKSKANSTLEMAKIIKDKKDDEAEEQNIFI